MNPIQVQKVHTLKGHNDCLYVLEKKNDKEFFSAGADGMIVLWNLDSPENGQLIAQIPSSCYALCYIPEDEVLVVGQNFEGIQLIDVKNKQVINSLKFTETAIFDLLVQGDKIFAATGFGELFRIDRNTMIIEQSIKLTQESLRCLELTNDVLLVGSSDNRLRAVQVDTLQAAKVIDAHSNSIFSVAKYPSRQYVLTGSRDAHLKFWDIASFELIDDIVAHMYAINHIAFSPTGQHFVTCSMDKSIKVWDSDERKLLKVIDRARHAGHGTSVNKLVWMEYNDWVVSCSDDRTISVWDINFGTK